MNMWVINKNKHLQEKYAFCSVFIIYGLYMYTPEQKLSIT